VKTKQFNPWRAPLDPNTPILRAALEQLEYQHRAVQYWLRRACRTDRDDVHAIHQLRVWIRRTLATLALYDPILPPKQTAKTERLLRRIARSARQVRDADVLLARLTSWPASKYLDVWIKALRKDRNDHRISFLKDCEEWVGQRKLQRRARRLLKHAAKHEAEDVAEAIVPPTDAPFASWASQRFLTWIEDYCQQAPPIDDMKRLHAFRLRGKQLRYAMEHLSGLFPKFFRTRLYARLQKQQQRLGEVNDLYSLLPLLQRRVEESANLREAETWGPLFYEEQHNLQRALRRTAGWLTNDGLLELRNEFREAMRGNFDAVD